MQTEDYSVVELCRKGNSEAFAILVERYQGMVYNIAFRMLGDAEAAKDMAQDSFIAAYEALKDFRSDSKFSTWLCSIVLNKCRDHLKCRRPHVAIDEIAELPAPKASNPEDELLGRQLGKGIQGALNALPADSREVIVLKHIKGLDYKEMETVLGISVNTLKVRTHRARELLRKRLLDMGVIDEQ